MNCCVLYALFFILCYKLSNVNSVKCQNCGIDKRCVTCSESPGYCAKATVISKEGDLHVLRTCIGGGNLDSSGEICVNADHQLAEGTKRFYEQWRLNLRQLCLCKDDFCNSSSRMYISLSLTALALVFYFLIIL